MLEYSKSITELNRLFRKSPEASNDAELSCHLAKLHLRNGDKSKAEEILKKLLKESPNSVQVMVECASCYAAAGALDDAQFLLERALEVKSGYVPAYIAMAGVYESRGDLQKQISFLMLAANAAPEKYEVRIAIAEKLKGYGDINGAIEQYNKILEEKPGLEIALFSIGSLLMKQDKISEAIEYFKKILNNNPSAFDAHFNLANCYFRQKKYAIALNHFNFAMRKQELVQRSLYLTSQCCFKLGDTDRAVVTMEKLCELDDKCVPYKKCLAEFYEIIEEFDMAVDVYRELTALVPERSEFSLKLAKCLLITDNTGEAEQILREMFTKHPKDLEGHKLLGELLAGKKQYKDAVGEYQFVLMNDKKYPGIYRDLANVYRETENFTEEQKVLEYALSIGDEQPDMLLRLGEIERKLNLPVSVERFIRVTEIAPDTKYAKEAEYYLKYAA